MENKSVAIFIDAENISFKYAKDIFNIASSYGELIIKRIYADWRSPALSGWKDEIAEHSIIAIQNFKFNRKNSSDSDYIPLTQKLRESKKQVIGMGENKANKFYINAFSAFHYLDKKEEKSDKVIKELFAIINQLIEEKNRAEYAQISLMMQRKYPDFNRQNYGCRGFRELIKKFIGNHYKEVLADDGCTYYLVKN